jgi:hypothetical protein
MKKIAPQSDSFAFPIISAASGLDYVPRDNFRINAHEGEAVLTKQENAARRNRKSGGDIIINVNYHGTVIEEKKAAQDIALLIYPQLHKLKAWGH